MEKIMGVKKMTKITLPLIITIFLFADGYPEWFFESNQNSVPVCIAIKKSISTARTIALAKAKAEVQRIKKVDISSEIVLEKSATRRDYQSSFKEVIKQKASGIMQGQRILRSGIYNTEDGRQYCILYWVEKLN